MSRGRRKSSSSRKFTSSRTHSAAVHPRKRSVLETSGLLHGWRFLDKEPKENLKRGLHKASERGRHFIDTKLRQRRSKVNKPKRIGTIYRDSNPKRKLNKVGSIGFARNPAKTRKRIGTIHMVRKDDEGLGW